MDLIFLKFASESCKALLEAHFQFLSADSLFRGLCSLGLLGWSLAAFLLDDFRSGNENHRLFLVVVLAVQRIDGVLLRNDARLASFSVQNAFPELDAVAIEVELEDVLLERRFHSADLRSNQFQWVRWPFQQIIDLDRQRLRRDFLGNFWSSTPFPRSAS